MADILKWKKPEYMIFVKKKKKNAASSVGLSLLKSKGLIMHHPSRLVKVKPPSKVLLGSIGIPEPCYM